eukprot:scaffold40984_cov61-Phaeocystis_antarctica.AAC.6
MSMSMSMCVTDLHGEEGWLRPEPIERTARIPAGTWSRSLVHLGLQPVPPRNCSLCHLGLQPVPPKGCNQ